MSEVVAEKTGNKILALESLRGLAALIVVFSHFMQAFYPGTLVEGQVRHSGFEALLIKTPLSAFFNGTFAVVIFFVLSGFVLSFSFFKKKDFDLVTATAKRYFRLMPIVFVSILLAFFMLKLGLFYNSQAGVLPSAWNNHGITLPAALWEGLFGAFAVQIGDSSLNSVLWTIYYELIGSVLVYAILGLMGKDRRRIYIYPLLILIFINTQYVSFIVGLILADLYCNKNSIFESIKRIPALYKVAALLGSVYLASFPPFRGAAALSTIHSPLLLFSAEFYTLNATVLYVLSAIIIITLLLTSRRLKRFFEIKPLVFLGSISYSLYATHILVLGSIGAYVYLKASAHLGYNASCAVSFVFYILSTLAVASIVRKYVDKPSIELSRIVGDKVSKLKKHTTEQT